MLSEQKDSCKQTDESSFRSKKVGMDNRRSHVHSFDGGANRDVYAISTHNELNAANCSDSPQASHKTELAKYSRP